MKIDVVLCGPDDRHVLGDLFPLYLHEITAFEDLLPNAHGSLDTGADVRTLAERAQRNAAWRQHPETPFPYLILVDGAAAGFNTVARREHLPAEPGVDFAAYGGFVLHAFRRDEVMRTPLARQQGADDPRCSCAGGRGPDRRTRGAGR